MLQPTRTIPRFSAPASTGMTLSSEAFRGRTPLVLFFLTDSPDSIAELSEVNRRLAEFGAQRVQVLGIAKMTASQTRRLAADHGWKFPIIADASGSIRRDFAVGPDEATVVISDVDGRILHIDGGVAKPNRAATVLDLLTNMKSDGRMAETART